MRTYTPCAEYVSTTPFTLLPILYFSTNSRNGVRSLTAVVGLVRALAAGAAVADVVAAFVLAASLMFGGGVRGIGIGLLASRLAFLTDFAADGRTGKRSINTQPTRGTGLPPINRPPSNNHG